MSAMDSYTLFSRKGARYTRAWNELIYGQYSTHFDQVDAPENQGTQAPSLAVDSASEERQALSQPQSCRSWEHDRQPSGTSLYCREHLEKGEGAANEDLVPCSLGLASYSTASSPILLGQRPVQSSGDSPVAGQEGAPCASEKEGLDLLQKRLISEYERAFKEKTLLYERLETLSRQLMALDGDAEDQGQCCEDLCVKMSRDYDDEMNRLRQDAAVETDGLHQKYQERNARLRSQFEMDRQALRLEYEEEARALSAKIDARRESIENAKDHAIADADRRNKQMTAEMQSNFAKIKAEIQNAQEKIKLYDAQIHDAIKRLSDCGTYTALFVVNNFRR